MHLQIVQIQFEDANLEIMSQANSSEEYDQVGDTRKSGNDDIGS